MEKWDLEAEQRRYVASTWTGHRPPLPDAHHSKQSRRPRWIIGVGVAAFIAMGSVTAFAFVLRRSHEKKHLTNTTVASIVSAPVVSAQLPLVDPKKILTDRVMNASNAAEAAKLCPLKDDFNDVDEGVMLLTRWAATKMTWDEVASKDNTTLGRVMKDPDAERGHHLCAHGTVIEIHTMKLDNGNTYYFGGIMDSEPVRFLAVHSSGDVVAGANARVCGTVVGISSYNNVSGGQTQAVQMVGMLDLPENRGVGSRSFRSKTDTTGASPQLAHGSAAQAH